MADYAIGDVQGCYTALQRLLDVLHYDDRSDRLWFVGDLVNRGPDSLKVIRFIKNLASKPHITLGNHDLHLLGRIFVPSARRNSDDTLQEIIFAPDAEEIGHWLRQQSMLHFDAHLNIVMTHAGIAPMWSLADAVQYARELESALAGEHYSAFLHHMYGNTPDLWSNDLKGMERLRTICNYFTRMRFCNAEGRLQLTYKGTLEEAPSDLYPWYATPNRVEIYADLIFGHWAALRGQCPHPYIHALDTGCLWGGQLTALRLNDKQRFVVTCS